MLHDAHGGHTDQVQRLRHAAIAPIREACTARLLDHAARDSDDDSEGDFLQPAERRRQETAALPRRGGGAAAAAAAGGGSTATPPLMVLEVDVGVGRNVPFYPEVLRQLHSISVSAEPDREALARAREANLRLTHTPFERGGWFPQQDNRFDFVVATLKLCTVDLQPLLQEVWRVLRPGGMFCMLEHVRATSLQQLRQQRQPPAGDPGDQGDDGGEGDRPPRASCWASCLNPFQQLVGVGCHLNRRFPAQELDLQGFDVAVTACEHSEASPRRLGSYVVAHATKRPPGAQQPSRAASGRRRTTGSQPPGGGSRRAGRDTARQAGTTDTYLVPIAHRQPAPTPQPVTATHQSDDVHSSWV